MPVNSKLKIFIQKSLKGLNEEEIKMICSLLRRAEREMVGIPQFWGERIDEFLIRSSSSSAEKRSKTTNFRTEGGLMRERY